MAIAHVVNDIAMTGYTIATLCRCRRVVGTTLVMARGAISHCREVLIMAVQASVIGVVATITVTIGIGYKRTRRNGLTV